MLITLSLLTIAMVGTGLNVHEQANSYLINATAQEYKNTARYKAVFLQEVFAERYEEGEA